MKLLQKRVWEFFDLFADEGQEIRKEISAMLPAYNDLLNMHAKSFEEFALQLSAEEQGIDYTLPLFDFHTVIPPCPKCGSHSVIHKGKDRYFCKDCELKFSANWRSISSYSKIPSVMWMKVLRCMLDYYSIEKTCSVCGISPTTYYNIRNRLFYAMEIALNNIKLYGIIQCDHTFVNVSYKGMDLYEDDFPEDSPLYTEDFKPREARSRGGSYSKKEHPINSVCIFAATDEFGHSITRFIGLGSANNVLIREAVKDRLLLSVPEDVDTSKTNKINLSKPGEKSLLVSDGEAAIALFARQYGIEHESHVYRKNNKQLQLSSNAHDIQQVNALHSRLKRFLIKTNNVSTKYLPGYLTFFEWIENTGATEEAIKDLFLILSTPNMGPPATFFKEHYSVPNYLLQMNDENNIIKKYSQRKRLAFYLYDQRVNAIRNGNANKAISMDEIVRRTGYAKITIRRNHKNIVASGLGPMVNEYFLSQKEPDEKIVKHSVGSIYEKSEVLALFDEYRKHRNLPKNKRLTDSEFTKAMNEKYGTNYKTKNLMYYFSQIVKRGLRPELPKRTTYAESNAPSPWEETCIEMQNEYSNLIKQYRAKGEKIPSRQELIEILGKQLGLSASTVISRLDEGSRVVNKMKNKSPQSKTLANK